MARIRELTYEDQDRCVRQVLEGATLVSIPIAHS